MQWVRSIRPSPRRGAFLASSLLVALFGTLVAVGAAAAQSVTVEWDPNPEPDVAGYLVSVGLTPGAAVRTVDVGDVTSWYFPRPVRSGTYYFRVQAYNTAGLVSA